MTILRVAALGQVFLRIFCDAALKVLSHTFVQIFSNSFGELALWLLSIL